MIAKLSALAARLFVGPKLTLAIQLSGIAFLQEVAKLVRSDVFFDLQKVRSTLIREGEAATKSLEADSDTKVSAAAKIAAAAERDKAEVERARVEINALKLESAKKKSEAAHAKALRDLEIERLRRIRDAEAALIDAVLALKMKGGSVGIDQPDLLKLIEGMKQRTATLAPGPDAAPKGKKAESRRKPKPPKEQDG